MNDTERIEQILALRKPRKIKEGEKEFLEEHKLECLECLKAATHPGKFKPCISYRLYTTDPDVYDYEEKTKWSQWHDSIAKWKAAIKTQQARDPVRHRVFADGVRWCFPPDERRDYKYPQWSHEREYVRIEWSVSTFQVIVGHLDGFKSTDPPCEELIYHSYAQCE